jgi:uncharacterized protein
MSADIKAILPQRTVDSTPFWEGCNQDKLLLRHCQACDQLSYFPRSACPHCGGRALDWREASGRATIYSFTHVAVSFYGPEWESQLPYTPVLVDLEEGPRMLSRLIGAGRDLIRIGDRVQLVFVEVEGQRLPYFQRSAPA